MSAANDVLATRLRLGWTQAKLAEALSVGDKKVAARTVRYWEAGDREPAPYLPLALAYIEQQHRGNGPRKRVAR